MENRRVRAIRQLETQLKHDRKFKKDLNDYIEIIVTDELESCKMSLKKLKKIRKDIAFRIIDLIDANWWEFQQQSTTANNLTPTTI